MRRNQISSSARNGPVHLNMTSHAQRPDLVFREKRTSPFKSARWGRVSSVDCRSAEVCGISGSDGGYTVLRGSVKGTGYPLDSPSFPFTSPPVRHRVQSHFNWSLPPGLTLEFGIQRRRVVLNSHKNQLDALISQILFLE